MAGASHTAVLECGGSKLLVAPGIGGAIASWRWRDADILRPSHPEALARADVRGLACYPLVPYSNRIAGARLHFGGTPHTLARNFGDHPNAIHGLGWQRPWTVLEQWPHGLRLGLVHDAATPEDRAAWPWPFRVEQAVQLQAVAGAMVLLACMTIRSGAAEPFPFGLGWHPYFPCDAATLLGFSATSVWQNDATQLPLQRVAVPPQWRFDPPRPVDGVELDNVFNGWRGTATLEQPHAGLHLRLDADSACTHLVVYAPRDRGFVAVEPVTHETDAFNRAARGAADTGTRLIAPGQSFSCTMRLTVHPVR
jgi:aldose 1-epimerase